MRHLIQIYDVQIVEGYRGEQRQNALYQTGKSQLQWPNSMHNRKPSLAVDVVPYPIDWEDRERFYYMAGLIMGIGEELHIPIRWGGDWDQDREFKDNEFDDLAHFELVQK